MLRKIFLNVNTLDWVPALCFKGTAVMALQGSMVAKNWWFSGSLFSTAASFLREGAIGFSEMMS